jgi:hypothetical protein
MSEQAKHTPTPWRIETMRPHTLGKAWINAEGMNFVADCSSASARTEHGFCGRVDYEEIEANAAFIVRACNSHKDLLSAAKEALSALNRLMPNIVMDAKDSLRLAIRDAEAEQ